MSKKPMYLKRRASSKMLAAVLVIIGIVALHWAVKDEKKPLDNKYDFVIEQTDFKGQVEEITAPKSKVKAYYMYQKGRLTSYSLIFAQAGSAYEPAGKEGVALLTAAVMKEGAGWWSAKELRNLLRRDGIRLGFAADKDNFNATLTFPQDKITEAVKYLREIFKDPHFEAKYLENAKDNQLKTLAAETENPAVQLGLQFGKMMFGDFAYGRNPLGSAESIKGISRRDLVALVRNNLNRNKLFVGIVGGLSKEEAAERLDEILMPLSEGEYKDIGAAQINWRQEGVKMPRDMVQNILVYATEAACRQCADFYPLYMANYLFGGAGLNSRLNQRMREAEGVTYGASSWLELNDKANWLEVNFAAAGDKAEKAKQLFAEEWRKVQTEGFSAEELQRVKNYMTASFNLRFASTTGIAEMLAYCQKYGLGIDFLQKRNQLVEKVSLDELNAAARKYFGDNVLSGEIGNIN
ncbi:MAG: insulinase family protein [Alphaproteobacteria bacterium]|nr:insulinase family protein [Alphaproteobacteria bacterium]